MKIATLFFIIGMLLMLLLFKTSFESATQERVYFHISDTYFVITKTRLYLYMALFFVTLFFAGLLVSRKIHKAKREKLLKKTSA